MNIELIQLFLEVVELGSFKKVAERHLISQRAVSKKIGTLEMDLGVALFKRQANRISLTPAGHFFYTASQEMTNRFSEALREIQTLSGNTQEVLSVGYFSIFESHVMQARFQTFKQAHPAINLIFREESIEHLSQSILNGDLDLAFTIVYGQEPFLPNSQVQSKTVLEREMVLGISKQNPLSQQDSVLPRDLADTKVLYYSAENSAFLQRSFETRNPELDPHQLQRVTSVEQMELLVALDQAVAFYPADINDPLLNPNRQINFVPVQGNNQTYHLVEFWHAGNQNPALTKYQHLML
ncbi:LysR substrate-binding domain-containing protein [Lactiplantibacillus dongliensis]|uniref:LysR substrate-binding domain-containing protein n=1 Tax=Lactiplantibacillus dongliensis TaxID=2559919 RepID=A0ABW1R7Z5_9LACO|nr:LysR family transcriptional regulator [Lactiplantibacillus dongliensis]